MAYLPRIQEAALRRAMRTFPAVLVTGPRQSGKTTLLRQIWGRSHRFVSFEQPHVRSRALGDPVGFLRDNPPPLILDEIQYVPELLSHLKHDIDEHRSPGRYLMTGSQSLALMQGASQSLAGRVAVMTLLPFGAEELGTAKPAASIQDLLARVFGLGKVVLPGPKLKGLGDWLLRGAYPELRANPKVDAELWCSGYVQTYLERDVRTLMRVGDLNAFDRFIRLCAIRTGQLLNLSDLARDASVSVPTAKTWLSVLEASHELFLVPPHHRNFGKRLVKAPKLYFTDTALAANLAGLSSEATLLKGPMAGALFETAVVAGWRKAFFNRGLMPSIFHWRSSDGLEVDLLIEREGKLHAVEAKLTASPGAGDAHALSKWLALAGSEAAGAVVACDINESIALLPGIRAVPWWLV